AHLHLHSFPTRRSSDLSFKNILRLERDRTGFRFEVLDHKVGSSFLDMAVRNAAVSEPNFIMHELDVILLGLHAEKCQTAKNGDRSEEHTSEFQSLAYLV